MYIPIKPRESFVFNSNVITQHSYRSELTSHAHTDTSVGEINGERGHRAGRNLIPRGLFSSVVRGSLLNEGCHALLSVPRRDDLKRAQWLQKYRCQEPAAKFGEALGTSYPSITHPLYRHCRAHINLEEVGLSRQSGTHY